jgi:hypothetical protein
MKSPSAGSLYPPEAVAELAVANGLSAEERRSLLVARRSQDQPISGIAQHRKRRLSQAIMIRRTCPEMATRGLMDRWGPSRHQMSPCLKADPGACGEVATTWGSDSIVGARELRSFRAQLL